MTLTAAPRSTWVVPRPARGRGPPVAREAGPPGRPLPRRPPTRWGGSPGSAAWRPQYSPRRQKLADWCRCAARQGEAAHAATQFRRRQRMTRVDHPVIREARFFLAHTPGLVRHGSKPAREIVRDPSQWDAIRTNLRSFADVVAYAPHQVLLGNLTPDALAALPRPWYENPPAEAAPAGPPGRPVPAGG